MRQQFPSSIVARPTMWVLAVLLLAPLSFIACGEEDQDDSILDRRNIEQDDNQNNQTVVDAEYEAGPLDGYWELEWDGGEKFSHFTITHNLDDDILEGSFDSVGAGSGTLRTLNFDPDLSPDEEREPGRLIAEWSPFPGDPESNEQYTITYAYFVPGNANQMVGEISAVAAFDIRNFTMTRTDPPEGHGEEEEGRDDD